LHANNNSHQTANKVQNADIINDQSEREDLVPQIDNVSNIQTDNLNEEDLAVESWKRKSKKNKELQNHTLFLILI